MNHNKTKFTAYPH